MTDQFMIYIRIRFESQIKLANRIRFSNWSVATWFGTNS